MAAKCYGNLRQQGLQRTCDEGAPAERDYKSLERTLHKGAPLDIEVANVWPA